MSEVTVPAGLPTRPNQSAGLPAASPTPRRLKRPTWLDPRLAFGAVLVLGSVVAGARLVGGANHSYRLVALRHPMAAGSVLGPSDIVGVAVQVPGRGAGVYVEDPKAVVGRQLNRDVAEGELVPAAALGIPERTTSVTIPLAVDTSPPLSAGERIEVWLSTKACSAAVVLADVVVQGVRVAGAFSATGGQDVVVEVAPELADRVVTALAVGGASGAGTAVLRAGIIGGTSPPAGPGQSLADLSRCSSSTTSGGA